MFGRSVVQAVKDGLNVSAAGSGGYTYKTVARKVLAVKGFGSQPEDMRLPASADAWSGWDGLQMREMMEWLPDENSYLKPLESLTCAEARKLFAIPPVWISCFACYVGCLSEQQYEVLKRATGLDILDTIEKWRRDKGTAPSIMSVADAM